MAEGRRRVHERFGVVLEPEVQVSASCAGPRAGSCEAPAVADRRWSSSSRSAGGLPLRASATRAVEPRLTGRPADLGDRLAATTRSAVSAERRDPLLAAAADGRHAAAAAARRAAEAGPPRRAGAGTGPRPRRRAGGPPPLHRRQLLRRKRGGRELASGIELRFGDASRAAREVARGGGGPRRSVDHRARLCRPAFAGPAATGGSGTRCRRPNEARARAAANERACVNPRAERLATPERRSGPPNPRPRVRGETLKSWLRIELAGCLPAFDRGPAMPYVERNFRGCRRCSNP